ncbi:MAG: hypothetical protein Ta2B_25310 [Termitinemataceae bacterium]|nr:MAG: hypothetical protein Ta2B_25310 [Termitinemataceae bacterium]
MKALRCTIIFVFCVCSVLSCKRASPDDEIKLPSTPPLSRDVIGYGVVNANYTHLLDKQGGGKSLGFLRKGSIVEIIEYRPIVEGEKAVYWVLARGAYEGWMREDAVRIYPSKAQAITAAESLPQ